MLTFLTQLFETGEIIVPRQPSGDADVDDVRQLLSGYDSVARKQWPGQAPEFDMEVATKAASVLLIFCQAVVYRELDEHEIRQRLDRVGLNSDPTTSCHYSADLCFQFLADVHRLLARSAKEDPVLQLLESLAQQWPFSAIGIANTAPVKLPEFIIRGGMFRAYVDRVVARSDVGCCRIPMVAESVKASIGDYPALAPELHAAFESPN